MNQPRNFAQCEQHLGRSLTKDELHAIELGSKGKTKEWVQQHAFHLIEQAKHSGDMTEDGHWL